MDCSRRDFLKHTVSLAAAAATANVVAQGIAQGDSRPDIRLGMVTYQWGADWDVPTLIENLTKTKVLGVELRSTHAHHVEPSLSADQRKEVKKRFEDSAVKLVGLGMGGDGEYHHVDPKAVEKAIEAGKAFIKLSHDLGASGIKVRPNDLPKQVPPEKTIEQIGRSLNTLGAFAADYGQQVRLEVHGGCCQLSIIKQIMDIATNPNVAVCWNSNQKDLDQPGLERNFGLVKARLGQTAHIRPLDTKGYPWQDLIRLFVKAKFHGWLLLEASTKVPDRIQALIQQRELFEQMLAEAVKA